MKERVLLGEAVHVKWWRSCLRVECLCVYALTSFLHSTQEKGSFNLWSVRGRGGVEKSMLPEIERLSRLCIYSLSVGGVDLAWPSMGIDPTTRFRLIVFVRHLFGPVLRDSLHPILFGSSIGLDRGSTYYSGSKPCSPSTKYEATRNNAGNMWGGGTMTRRKPENCPLFPENYYQTNKWAEYGMHKRDVRS